jgi:hypothetical protein
VVSQQQNGRVQAFWPNGSFSYAVASLGHDDNQLWLIHVCAYASRSPLRVLPVSLACVLARPKHISMYICMDRCKQDALAFSLSTSLSLRYPIGLAVNHKNHIIVADYGSVFISLRLIVLLLLRTTRYVVRHLCC